eukprot:2368718-Pyramimonas_sp.AAC.1
MEHGDVPGAAAQRARSGRAPRSPCWPFRGRASRYHRGDRIFFLKDFFSPSFFAPVALRPISR